MHGGEADSRHDECDHESGGNRDRPGRSRAALAVVLALFDLRGGK
jgi:hypothetical protein